MQRQLTLIDKVVCNVDLALRTLVPSAANAHQVSPAQDKPAADLDAQQQQHTAGLMRINHTGEVCAQALYQGQALTAKLPDVREEMQHAAEEEIDHLVWCEQRLQELGSRTSVLLSLIHISEPTRPY